MKNYTSQIQAYLNEEIEVMQKIDIQAVSKVIHVLEETRKNGSTVYICGNGGSASTASHFASDFNKGVSGYYEKKYHIVCLSDNTASLTAVANDIGYSEVFRVPLQGRLKKGDVLIAVSGSGNSENVVRAVQLAKEQGILVIGMTGYSGGRVKQLADISLHIPVRNMQITEDIHLILNHLMMYILAYGETDSDRSKTES